VSAIQAELARRGFYVHAVDGLYGPKTDTAIRDFEQAAGLKPNTALDDALLQTIVGAPAQVTKLRAAAPVPRAAPARNSAPAPALAQSSSSRVVALQRALADYGYGQIKPSGIVDAPTRAAIEKFERVRKLPVTGQVSDRLLRELAAVTGRPLE
jgi:peptidoglycan hydrolase-like protein with peptidoglycan-binding domain